MFFADVSLWEEAIITVVIFLKDLAKTIIIYFLGLFPVDDGILFNKISTTKAEDYYQYMVYFIPFKEIVYITGLLIAMYITTEVLFSVIQLIRGMIHTLRG